MPWATSLLEGTGSLQLSSGPSALGTTQDRSRVTADPRSWGRPFHWTRLGRLAWKPVTLSCSFSTGSQAVASPQLSWSLGSSCQLTLSNGVLLTKSSAVMTQYLIQGSARPEIRPRQKRMGLC